MKRAIFAGGLFLASLSAHAATPLCTDWPTILGASGPDFGLAGFPFTFNVRLSCLLGDSYTLGALEGDYAMSTGLSLPRPLALSTFPLPGGNILYQYQYSVPATQPPGQYQLKGCVRVTRAADGASLCWPVQQGMELGRDAGFP